MATLDPDWTASRRGQDWRDKDLLTAVNWLKSFVPRHDMDRRLDAAKANLTKAREQMREGHQAPLYDPSDLIAWYILQVETFATDRRYWTPEGIALSAPFFKRIGAELPLLRTIKGVEERAARMMLAGRRQADSSIYEILVALAYRRGGWDRVEFVPEMRGRGQTPDIHVFRPRSRWAVECKRLAPSPYAQKEKARGVKLAEPVHSACLEMNTSVIVEVNYKTDLDIVPDHYLVERVAAIIKKEAPPFWDDECAIGQVRSVNWPLTRKILAKDYVYFGSSRMIELLAGSYSDEVDHSMAAKWRPWPKQPDYADAVYQASVVSWRSLSKEARLQKARHFRKLLSNADSQLPLDRPGVIHIGIEAPHDAEVDITRHIFNTLEARSFVAKNSRLRWVYANFFVPELTTRRNESWAITETTVPYKVGAHSTRWPLPGHMIITPENETRPGVHWDGGAEM